MELDKALKFILITVGVMTSVERKLVCRKIMDMLNHSSDLIVVFLCLVLFVNDA